MADNFTARAMIDGTIRAFSVTDDGDGPRVLKDWNAIDRLMQTLAMNLKTQRILTQQERAMLRIAKELGYGE